MTRAARRRLLFGLQTVLGTAQRGFFIPYARAQSVMPPEPLEWVEARFAAALPCFMAAMDDIDALAPALEAIGGASPPEPRWDQDWFPRLDAAMLYALARQRPPRRVVEVGSGHSTRFLLRALRDSSAETVVTAIDPAPRADLTGLEERLTLRRQTVQEVGSRLFATLEAGDWLVVDSSHIAMPGTDVDFLFGHILPALPSGVLLHVHDIFLPDPYPEDWAWRGYNEQLAAALLLAGGWQPLFASHYMATRHPDRLAHSALAALPMPPGARNTSLWLCRDPV
ncbi:MAG: class I SAM-dependent methyltransferase [Alphaproteobacteria bacterium]|nr:class I SAM-dependent methyltransferase [Alphaproteobacteria bacterium]